MDTDQIVPPLVAGVTALVLGLVPGPLRGLRDGIQTLIDGFPVGSDPDAGRRLPGQIWLAVAGALVIVLTLLAYALD